MTRLVRSCVGTRSLNLVAMQISAAISALASQRSSSRRCHLSLHSTRRIHPFTSDSIPWSFAEPTIQSTHDACTG